MTDIPSPDPYYDNLAQHANALIPAMGGICDEDDGAYLALGDVRRFFFHAARTREERAQVLAFLNHTLETGSKLTEEAIVLELFTEVYALNEPFTSLFREHLSPSAWALFLTYREFTRKQGFYG
jgi:hypothetical protein